MIFFLSFPALVRPFRCTRSPNGIAKVLLFFYSANFFEVFLKNLHPAPIRQRAGMLNLPGASTCKYRIHDCVVEPSPLCKVEQVEAVAHQLHLREHIANLLAGDTYL